MSVLTVRFRPRRHARSTRAATSPSRRTRCSNRAERHRCPESDVGRMVGDGAAVLVARAFAAAANRGRLMRSTASSPSTASACCGHTRPYHAHPGRARRPRPRAELRSADEQAAGRHDAKSSTVSISPGSSGPAGSSAAMERSHGSRTHPGLLASVARCRRLPSATVLVGDSTIDWRTARAASTAICLARYGFGFETFRRRISGRPIGRWTPRRSFCRCSVPLRRVGTRLSLHTCSHLLFHTKLRRPPVASPLLR